MQPPLTLYLFPQSPWSKKAKAVLDYKEIEVRQVTADALVRRRVLKPALGPVTSPVLWGSDGPSHAIADSTEIALWAETHKPDPSIRHDDPGLEVVSRILDETFDEWLSRHYLAFKWLNAQDRSRNTELIMKALLPQAPGLLRDRLAPRVVGPILEALPRHGVTEETKPVLTASLKRFLAIVEPIHYDSDCLLGPYPVLADFSALALLSQIQRDPSGERMLLEEFPEFCAYLNQMEANTVSRVERRDAWAARQKETHLVLDRISQVLEYVAREFFAFMIANAAALAEGRKDVSVELSQGETYRAPASESLQGRFRFLLEQLDGLRKAGGHLLPGGDSRGERALSDQVARAKGSPGSRDLFSGLSAL